MSFTNPNCHTGEVFRPARQELDKKRSKGGALDSAERPSLEAERIHIVVVGHTLQKVSLALAPADVVE